jgi:hypothetical protein
VDVSNLNWLYHRDVKYTVGTSATAAFFVPDGRSGPESDVLFMMKITLVMAFCRGLIGCVEVEEIKTLFTGIAILNLYKFMNSLAKFCQKANAENKAIWLSPTVGDLVHIDEVYLMTLTSGSARDSKTYGKFVYNGVSDVFDTYALSKQSIKLWSLSLLEKRVKYIKCSVSKRDKPVYSTALVDRFNVVRDKQLGMLINTGLKLRGKLLYNKRDEEKADSFGEVLMLIYKVGKSTDTGKKVIFQRTDGFMNADTGGFSAHFGHFLPALFLNQLLPHLGKQPNSKVEMHVICMGSVLDGDHPWTHLEWKGDSTVPDVVVEVLDALYKGQAFLDVLKKVNRPFVADDKPIRRVCIWMYVKGHVVSFWWEITVEGSCFFVVDNLGVPTRLTSYIIDYFVDKRAVKSGFTTHHVFKIDYWLKLIRSDGILIGGGLTCVSYMSRITLYMSMVDYPSFVIKNGKCNATDAVTFTGELSSSAGFYQERQFFADFLESLTRFVERENGLFHLILKSPMQHYFVNFEDVSLRTLRQQKRKPAEGMLGWEIDGEYVYRDGFVPKDSDYGLLSVERGCVTCTQFSLLPHIRECKLLVDAMRLYKSV